MLKKLKKCLESEKNEESIFDIVVYGSFVKSDEYRDVDIAFIFKHGSLRERLEKMQEAKAKLARLNLNIDAKAYLLEDLFSKSNFARQGIFIEGISIFDEENFSEKIGFRPFAIFSYSMSGKTHAEKVKFNYLLAGRNSKGILELFNGERISRGTIKLPVKHEAEMEKIFSDNNIPYKKKRVLEENSFS